MNPLAQERPDDLEAENQEHALRRTKAATAKALRRRSSYPRSSSFRPSEEALARRKKEVLAVLRLRGSRGVTRLDAPEHLRLSLAQRISELRGMGYRINSEPEPVGDTRVARYRLIETAEAPG